MNNWTDKYLLNIDAIDKQHKVFFELWDKECREADLNNNEQLSEIIHKLEDYITNHFSTEEKILINSGFKEVNNHINQHKYFIQKVNEMKMEQKYMNALLFEKISAFIKKWFLNHIMQTDKTYQKTVQSYLNKNEE